MNNIELSRCSNCGGNLVHGYLLGKHNRIRWSISDKGMTIFHGVPLNTLKNGFWKSWKNWCYAPSMPAARCEKCKIVLMPYDNEEKENPRNERLASRTIGAFLMIAGIAMGGGTLFAIKLLPESSLLFSSLGGMISLLLFLLGLIFLKHAADKQRTLGGA